MAGKKGPRNPDGTQNGQQKSVRLTQERRRQKVADYILMDWTYREISHELGIAISTISNDVKVITEEWKEVRVETVEQLKSKQLRRLGKLRSRAWKRVDENEAGAISEALKVEQEYNKIAGIYAPAVVEMSGQGGEPLFPTTAIVAALRAAEEAERHGN